MSRHHFRLCQLLSGFGCICGSAMRSRHLVDGCAIRFDAAVSVCQNMVAEVIRKSDSRERPSSWMRDVPGFGETVTKHVTNITSRKEVKHDEYQLV